jgi:hypothetical protein
MSAGFERLHYLLESAFDADGGLSPAFLRARMTVLQIIHVLTQPNFTGCPFCWSRPLTASEAIHLMFHAHVRRWRLHRH